MLSSMNSRNIEIIYKDNIPYNIRYNNKYVHSKYDPYKEAKRQFFSLIEQINPFINVIICYKVGLGFIIEEIIKNTNYKILWIEPDIFILEKAKDRLNFAINDFRSLIEKRIIFSNLFDVDLIRNLGKDILKYELFYLKSYLNQEDYKIIDLFYRKRFYYQVNYNTAKKFEKLWISNFYKNLIFSKYIRPINHLNNRFQKFNAIIVCGGPSLDYWINSIKKIQNKILIICVDTALNTLIKNQIIPDFVISVDAQIINYLHLEKNLNLPFHLVCDPVVYYLTIKNYLLNRKLNQKKVYIFNNTLPYVSFIYKKLFSDIDFLKSGGSVSTTALDFACYLGCSNIFFTGLDFGFPDNIVHTKYSSIEFRLLYYNNRLYSLEYYNYKQLTSLPTKYCLNLKNEKIITNDKLMIFKNWFEKHYSYYKHLNLFLLYGNGCPIKNFHIIFNEKEFLQLLTSKEDKKQLIINEDINTNYDLYKFFTNLNEKLQIIKELIDRILNTIHNFQNDPSNKKYIESLFILEQELFRIEELNLFPYLEASFINYEIDDFKENIKISKEVYQNLKENVQLHINHLSKSLWILQRLEKDEN
ncbi:MAG: hypothetical protein KatS3mg129_1198 [Leptospiraceae bacterium]|nr:MAG: hypothetical protein KatS3mg129_1198 [Leptospiraceae bacterium]